MVVDETIPTIAELKGNTILELFKSAYNKIRGVLSRKQDKLIAGDNIVIDAETNEISAIVGGEPVLDNYYTKPETDAKISEELTDYYKKTEVYDKTETDGLLANKANSSDVYPKTETYTKTEVDNLVSPKANSSDVYAKSETYTKTEVDNLVSPKANSSDVYTKTETNNLLSGKANTIRTGHAYLPTATIAGLTITKQDSNNRACECWRYGDILVFSYGVRVSGTFTGTSNWYKWYEYSNELLDSGEVVNFPYADDEDNEMVLNGGAFFLTNGSTFNNRGYFGHFVGVITR